MSKQIKSNKGLFGQIVHYEGGIKVGESWPGLFSRSMNHYDADGKYIGYSDRGIFVEQVHRDVYGNYIGETRSGFFGQKKHYSADFGYTGETWDGFVGDATDFLDESDFFGSQESNDFFDCGEW